MTICGKVAYLKGLVDGLGVDENTKEGKIFKAMIDILDELALSVDELEDAFIEIGEQVDALDEDVNNIIDDCYDLSDDDCEDCDNDELYDVVCPSCKEVVCIDEDILNKGEISCPSCGELLEFDLDDIEVDSDC